MTPATCTVRYATSGPCGLPAVRVDGAYAECEAHVTHTTVYPTAGEAKAAKARTYCRRAACRDLASGTTLHLAGTCG